ncbi:MAG: hypothetical protein GY835_03195 [bacterium]|nr:hypothetical protein [bacterium]
MFRTRLSLAAISLSVLVLCLCFGCSKDSESPPAPTIPILPNIVFESVTPTTGAPGTIITVYGVQSPDPSDDLVIVFDSLAFPVHSQADSNVMFACPLLPVGSYQMFVDHPSGSKTQLASFQLTESPPTGKAPGQVAEELTNSISVINQSISVCGEVLESRGMISTGRLDTLRTTMSLLDSVLADAAAVLSALPDSEKVALDQQLVASGLADLFGSSGYFRSIPSSSAALRSFLSDQGEYDAFHGLILGDNISFGLSAVKAALKVINVASLVGSLGLSAPANISLTVITFAIGAVDSVIEGFMPTDLYRVDLVVVPPDGAPLKVGQTAEIEYWGSFRSQTGPVTASLEIFVNGVFAFLPAATVDKLVADILVKIEIGALSDILGDQQVITLPGPVKIDPLYYAKSAPEVLQYITNALSGIMPGVQLMNVLSYAGLSFPSLAVEPLVINSNLVEVSEDLLTLTTVAEGTVEPSQISMEAWVMNSACDSEHGWWWTWVCLGIELPDLLEPNAFAKPRIEIDVVVQPDITAPARIDDLNTTAPTPGGLTLFWTAPGDDGLEGVASAYDIRYSESPIDESNWAAGRAPKPIWKHLRLSLTLESLSSQITASPLNGPHREMTVMQDKRRSTIFASPLGQYLRPIGRRQLNASGNRPLEHRGLRRHL